MAPSPVQVPAAEQQAQAAQAAQAAQSAPRRPAPSRNCINRCAQVLIAMAGFIASAATGFLVQEFMRTRRLSLRARENRPLA